ncbi:hypothetical protein H632_c1976p0, partial [Helicosporidium sp. ATCC 50920]
ASTSLPGAYHWRPGQDGVAEFPTYCRQGLPSDKPLLLSEAQRSKPAQLPPQEHTLAVLIPYRNREPHLARLLGALTPFLEEQKRKFDIFIIEQVDDYLFNRGALLNAATLLLQGSEYDYYIFQDVDTIPLASGNVPYAYPGQAAPLHLTPHWIHPKSTYEDFFGGVLSITPQQLAAVNGFGAHFWGWGREDDNLRMRLSRAGLWPPSYPGTDRRPQRHAFFEHQKHPQATELRARTLDNGTTVFVQEHPRVPFRGAKIMSSQPRFLQDFESGLNSTRFRLERVSPFHGAVRFSLQLHCNVELTPWCRPEAALPGTPRAARFASAVAALTTSV